MERLLKEEHSKTDNNAAKILQLKQRLKEIEENEMIGAAIRSRTEWREKGEKPTKFFFNLEKQKGEEKQLNEIRDENGDILKTKDEILSHIQKYYQIKLRKIILTTLLWRC